MLAERKPAAPVRFHVWGDVDFDDCDGRVVVTQTDSKKDGKYWGTKYDVVAAEKRYGDDGYRISKNAAWLQAQGLRKMFSSDDDIFAGKFTLTYPVNGSRVVHNGVAGAAADMVSDLAAKYPDREILREAMTRAGLTESAPGTQKFAPAN